MTRLLLLLLAGCAGNDGFLAKVDSVQIDLTAAEGAIYWKEADGRIRRVAEAGGSVSTLGTGLAGRSALRVLGDRIFFTDESAFGDRSLYSLAGGTAQRVAVGVDSYAVDEQSIYFLGADELWSQPIESDQRSSLLLAHDLYELHLAGDRLIYIKAAYQSLGVPLPEMGWWSVGKGGGTPHQLWSGAPRFVDGSDGNFYFTDESGQLWRIANDQATKLDGVVTPHLQAVAGGDAYYLDESGYPSSIAIARRAFDGSAPETLRAGNDDIQSVAVGASGVFFMTNGFYRQPRSNEWSSEGLFLESRPRIGRIAAQ
jgi:hypothetical protein